MPPSPDAESPPDDLLRTPNCLHANLRHACRAITRRYSAALAGTGLERTQFTLIAAVAGYGHATVSTLAARLGMDQTTVTRSLDTLERRGLLTSAAGSDRRTREVRLSGAGRAAYERALPRWRATQSELVERLGAERSRELLALVGEVLGALEGAEAA